MDESPKNYWIVEVRTPLNRKSKEILKNMGITIIDRDINDRYVAKLTQKVNTALVRVIEKSTAIFTTAKDLRIHRVTQFDIILYDKEDLDTVVNILRNQQVEILLQDEVNIRIELEVPKQKYILDSLCSNSLVRLIQEYNPPIFCLDNEE